MIFGMNYFQFGGLLLLTIFVLRIAWDLVKMSTAPDHGQTLSQLAHCQRREVLRQGRPVTAEEIQRDLDQANPPLYTPHSVQN